MGYQEQSIASNTSAYDIFSRCEKRISHASVAQVTKSHCTSDRNGLSEDRVQSSDHLVDFSLHI